MTPAPQAKPRELTQAECRQAFFDHLCELVRYWEGVNSSTVKTTRHRLEGLAFSILTMLDGVTDLPAFVVMPSPHEGDEELHRSEGTNWWPRFSGDGSLDIIGGNYLHDEFHEQVKRWK